LVSSRRLAREWALKILYQKDVGKSTLADAADAAMERMRMEFVHRGSRSASGSTAEQICLDYLTSELVETLPTLRRPFLLAITEVVRRLFTEATYWQELRFEVSFKSQAPGVALRPPRLRTPQADAYFLPAAGSPDPLASLLILLTAVERQQLRNFIENARVAGMSPPAKNVLFLRADETYSDSETRETVSVRRLLKKDDSPQRSVEGPAGKFAENKHNEISSKANGEIKLSLRQLLEPEMRHEALRNAKRIAAGRPLGTTPESLQQYINDAREALNARNDERWQKVAEVVQKQTSDWLGTAAFTLKLIHGTLAHQQEVDSKLEALSEGWRLERQVAVDRNIMRLAGYEMLFLPGIPTGASVNEAVELAKKYSTTESGRFVNGVLGSLAAQVGDKIATADTENDIEAGGQDTTLDLPDITEIDSSDEETPQSGTLETAVPA